MWCRFMGVVLFASLALPAWNEGLAQSTPATLRYFCLFDRVTSPDGVGLAKDFTLEFAVETASGKSVMIGNNGIADVVLVRGADAITFLERLESGVVQSTTITNTNEAIHSRHTVMAGELVPSQYYGSCRVVSGKRS